MNKQKLVITASRILFGISLLCPSVEEFDLFSSHHKVMPGFMVLIWGWYVIPFFHPAWLANVTWIVGTALFMKEKYKWSFYLSIATAALALDSYFYPSDWYVGFYLWNVAMSSLLVINLIHRSQQKQEIKKPVT